MKTYESVWDALEDDPVKAGNMKLRSELRIAIIEQIKDMKQTEAATLLKITQPRVSALRKGKLEAFRLDSLVNMALRLNLNVSVRVAA